jgi:hypothetical protein
MCIDRNFSKVAVSSSYAIFTWIIKSFVPQVFCAYAFFSKGSLNESLMVRSCLHASSLVTLNFLDKLS